ncbi:uncharacterized protein LOC113349515 [Papaver somniferum]|uniref:uncharacterized protein LOC113349515 n=1 Tax=Papaver somniferum TaxID=3469 RepID=UPI000E6F55DD|nr:uncharacterized protein LOC113349515 [Papaver somniferum]
MVEENKIMPMVNFRGVHPTHILFADDVFLFFNGHKRKIQKVLKLLQDYQSSSGQVVNQMKSKIFVGGVSEARKQQIANEYQMNLANFPEKYLGVILQPGGVKSSTVWRVVEMLQNRLASWIGKMLYFKDRLTLIKSILCSIPIYNMSVYKWHVSVVKICERLIRNFLWTSDPYDRKCVTLKWDETCAPMEKGGLSIRRMEVINKSLLMKLVWKIQNSKAEWARFMRAKFYTINGEWISGYKKSSIWSGLKWVIDEVEELPIISRQEDTGIWYGTMSGEFTVSSAVELIRLHYNKVKWAKYVWNSVQHPTTASNIWNYDFMIFKYFELKNQPIKIQIIVEIRFHLPEINQALICYDGASRGNPGVAVYGFICRGDHGEIIYVEAKGLDIANNFIAEVMAIIGAAEWAVQNSKFNICINSDSNATIKAYISGKLPWICQVRWNRIKQLL